MCELIEEDFKAIQLAKDTALKFIVQENLPQEKRVGLANALFALDRQLYSDHSIECEFSIGYLTELDEGEYKEEEYVLFVIYPSVFEIQTGCSEYRKSVGWDHISGPKWCIEKGGHFERACDLEDIKQTIDYFLQLGAEVTVYDNTAKSPLTA